MPEAAIHNGMQPRSGRHDAALLRELDANLHALSQPITVLLCTLEYSGSLTSMDEIRPLLVTAREASERLRASALSMRALLQRALAE